MSDQEKFGSDQERSDHVKVMSKSRLVKVRSSQVRTRSVQPTSGKPQISFGEI